MKVLATKNNDDVKQKPKEEEEEEKGGGAAVIVVKTKQIFENSAKSIRNNNIVTGIESSISTCTAAATTALPPTSATSTSTSTPTSPSSSSSSSYVIKCLLKTVRFMWQITAIPVKIGETFGTLYRYAHDSVDSFLCVAGKARRKERDGDQNSTDTKLYLEESVLERKLPEADLKALVDLPAGLDYNEWLASHTLALFEHVNLVYGTISEFCTPSGCADMTGPANRTYLWFDEKGKKTRVTAPQYIDYVMTFTQKTVSNELIFPTKYANEFPSSFESIARKILRLQFHVIAHLYAAHFREIALLGLHTHLNLTFAHLTALHRRFSLIDEKETDVLRDLEVALRLTDDNNTNTNSSSNSMNSSHNNSNSRSQHHQQQQQQQHDTNTTSASGGGGGGVSLTTTTNETILEQQQYNNSTHTTTTTSGSSEHVNSTNSLIDGDTGAPPICTQPEAVGGTRQTTAAHAVFGGGGGLIGGILGDLSSGEFGDTTRYCTSAVPQQQQQHASGFDAAQAANNGAGAASLYLNFNNNNNNSSNHQQQQQQHHTHLNHHHMNHHHHPHAHHHHHHGHGHGQLQQNSGLIQCNAMGGGVAANTAASVASAAATTANNSSSTTTTA